MTLQQIQYAVSVAETGSINRAAKELFLSQSRLSGAMQELERELGITLFLRTNRGVRVTPEGEEFLGYATSACSEEEDHNRAAGAVSVPVLRAGNGQLILFCRGDAEHLSLPSGHQGKRPGDDPEHDDRLERLYPVPRQSLPGLRFCDITRPSRRRVSCCRQRYPFENPSRPPSP